MGETRTSVKEVIPDVGQIFGLDIAVVDRLSILRLDSEKRSSEILQSSLPTLKSSRRLASALLRGLEHLEYRLSSLMEIRNRTFLKYRTLLHPDVI